MFIHSESLERSENDRDVRCEGDVSSVLQMVLKNPEIGAKYILNSS